VRICIVKLSAMGDIVHAMVALQFIKQKYPDAIIDWIVQENFKDILKNNPDINNILPVDLKSIKKQKSLIFDQIKLLTQYSKNNYDITIDAQGLIKSAIVSKIVGSRIVNSIIVGFDKNSIREKVASWFYDKKINIPYHANTIDRNVKVICGALDIDVSKDQIINKKRFLYFDPISLKLEDEFILFVVGSTWESRNYPKEKFVQIANSLKKQVYVVWGTQQEYQKALYMQQHSKYIKPLPKVNLDELKAIIYQSKLLIGNDTGPTHIAWGLNIPSITIFGPTPTNRVYVTNINKVVKSHSKVNHYKLDKNDFSICEIDPQQIINIAKELLK